MANGKIILAGVKIILAGGKIISVRFSLNSFCFQKIHGLYGLEHHTVEINGDVTMQTDKRMNEQKVNIELLSQWTV